MFSFLSCYTENAFNKIYFAFILTQTSTLKGVIILLFTILLFSMKVYIKNLLRINKSA